MRGASQSKPAEAVGGFTLWLLFLCALALAVGFALTTSSAQTRNRPKVADDEPPPPTPRPRRTPRPPVKRPHAADATPRATPRPTPSKPAPAPTPTPTPPPRLAVNFLTGAPQADVFASLDGGALYPLGKTDAEGKLTVRLIPGVYLITASHPAYRTHKKYIEVRGGETAFDFNLTNQPLATAPAAAPPVASEVIKLFLDPKQTDGVTASDWRQVERETAALFAQDPLNRQWRAQALFARGQLAYLARDFQEALANFHAATLAMPESPLAFYGLGNALLALNRLPDADAAFQRAVELNDKLAIAYRGAGDARGRLGKPEEARKNYERARALGYTSVELSANVARTWMWQRRWAQALAEWQQVAKERPSAEVFLDIGDCHTGLNQPDRAALAYRRAVELNPASAPTQYKYGVAAYDARDYAAAAAALSRALEIDPGGAKFDARRAGELLRKARQRSGRP
jgi:tetratricopeptide (TPR) repeat protein